MTVAEATPDFEQGDRDDRAFLGHPKGLGYPRLHRGLRALLLLFHADAARALHGQLPARCRAASRRSSASTGCGLASITGLEGQPLASAIFGDYTSLVYLTPILGGIIADKLTGRTDRADRRRR